MEPTIALMLTAAFSDAVIAAEVDPLEVPGTIKPGNRAISNRSIKENYILK